MKLTKRLFLPFVAALVVLSIAVGCGAKKNDGDAAGAKRQSDVDTTVLSVGVTPTADCLPAFVVVSSGIAERHGLQVRLAQFCARMDQDTAIVRRRVDGLFADSVNIAYLNQKGDVALTVCRATDAEWQLIAGRASRVVRLDQLGDKIIAHACFSATEWLTDKALKGVKTKADVYKVQVNDVKVRLNMLLESAVDAAWLPEPYASMALQHGHKKIADSKKYGTRLGSLAFTSKAMADKKKRADIDLFIKCLDEASDSIKKYGAAHYANCQK